MGAPDLIIQLRKTGCTIRADGDYLDIFPAENVPPDLLKRLKQYKPQILAALQHEQQQEVRRQKVLAMLAADPALRRAVHADMGSDPDNAILTIAIRHVASFEMKVSKANYDSWQLALVSKAGAGNTH